MGGLSNLGGSVFTLKVDDSRFTTGLQEAEKEARAAGDAIGTHIGMGSKKAQMGLLQLGYMVDDMQYGFRSIVNNIPQVAMAIGGPNAMAIAGAAGIAGVAINLLIQHWEQISTLWSESTNTIPQLSGATGKLTVEIKKLDEEILKLTKDQENLNTLDLQRLSILKQVSERGHAFITSEKEVTAAKSDLENEMGHAFTKAVGGVPGGASGLVELLKQNGMSAEDATRAVAGAMKGEGGMLEKILPLVPGEGAYMPLFRTTEAGIAREKQEKEDVKEAEKVQAREKQRKDERHRLEDQLNEAGMRFEQQGKHDELEAERKDIQERIRRGEHVLNPAARHQLQDMLLGGKAPHQSQLLSTKAFIDKTLTSGMNAVPQKQLDELKGMHDNLKSIDKKIADLGRLG